MFLELDKSLVLVVDGISEKTEEFTRKYITPKAEIIFSNYDSEVNNKYIADAHVLITSTKGIHADLLSKASKCIYIQKYGSGVNNIAINDANRRNIPVGAIIGGNARTVAEYALTLALAVYKQIVKGHNSLVGEGKWLKTVLRDNNYDVSGKKVGIIGFGNIGQNLRQLFLGFGNEVFYYDIFRLSMEKEKELNVTYLELDDLLSTCDLISLHCPLLPETKYLINEQRISKMKPNAVLVNCARGGIVEEKALYQALKEKRILGAGIDTYESEPMEKGHMFTTLDNVVLGPHNGGGTVECIEYVVKRASLNINSILTTGKVALPDDLVNLKDIKLNY